MMGSVKVEGNFSMPTSFMTELIELLFFNNMEEKIFAYKGFNEDLTCRDFQYEIGKEYEEENVLICKSGFHACENPLDVLNFYGDILKDRFCKVEQSGIIMKGDKKQASSKIKVISEIGFAGLFKEGIEWIRKITNPTSVIKEVDGKHDKYNILSSEDSMKISSSEDSSKIGSRGEFVKIGSSGGHVQIGSIGPYVHISSSGEYANIGSSGEYAYIASSGHSNKIGSSGRFAQIGSSGRFTQIGSSGYSAKISSSGYSAKIGSSGEHAKIGSSGDSTKIGSSGDYANIGSSGDYSKISSSGDYAKISSSGDYVHIESTGEDSVICCAGCDSIVKAKKGSWITLSEWNYSIENQRSMPICVKTEYVDGERIKADTWYKLIKGEFVEVEQHFSKCMENTINQLNLIEL